MKINRDAFLYMEPKGKQHDYAQCSSCVLMTSDKMCSVLGEFIEEPEETSCGLYAPGDAPLSDYFDDFVSKDDASFAERSVRCENCKFGDAKRKVCKLYEKLNKDLPELFELNTKISPFGCCNANTPK